MDVIVFVTALERRGDDVGWRGDDVGWREDRQGWGGVKREGKGREGKRGCSGVQSVKSDRYFFVVNVRSSQAKFGIFLWY